MFAKPALKGTRWTAVQEIFVADAGTMTITHTMEFISDKEVRIRVESHLPSHPAMYMNPDGTVDRIPASSSEMESAGTYSFRRSVLTIADEGGRQMKYTLKDGKLVGEEMYGETLVFSPVIQ